MRYIIGIFSENERAFASCLLTVRHVDDVCIELKNKHHTHSFMMVICLNIFNMISYLITMYFKELNTTIITFSKKMLIFAIFPFLGWGGVG